MRQVYFIPLDEIRRIRESIKDKLYLTTILADVFRINTLYMISKAGSGHIGSSFSCMDIITYLWMAELRNPNNFSQKNYDTFFSSKGHDIPALYSLLIGLEKLDFEYLHKLRRLNGLPGHPDIRTPYIATNTGSLGMGISKAKGMATAQRLKGRQGRIFVLLGDGELQEGQIWESFVAAANGRFSEITAIVDHNKIQSDTYIKHVNDLGDIEGKFRAFGWEVARCSGHDIFVLKETIDNLNLVKDRPKILIADTIKGKGVSFMESIAETPDGPMYKFHSGAPSQEDYENALTELLEKVNKNLKDGRIKEIRLELNKIPQIIPRPKEKLISAYGDELVQVAEERREIIVFDADLSNDCGLLPFKRKFPDRFFECGIAEQDMVSAAGGAALKGMLPIVHSFACFLSTRSNEHIYNNSTEKTKIIYVGSLAGLLPSGPGHSHQSVRDISALSAIPELTLVEPCNEAETRMVLKWAVEENPESTYIRLVSIPCETPCKIPNNYILQKGKGFVVKEGNEAVCFAYGPVMLSEAVKASEILWKQKNVSLKVVNLPWLNFIDIEWLRDVVSGIDYIFTIDDHYIKGGQGEMVKILIPRQSQVKSFGIDKLPMCGLNDEVLRASGLDSKSVAESILLTLR